MNRALRTVAIGVAICLTYVGLELGVSVEAMAVRGILVAMAWALIYFALPPDPPPG